MNILLARFGSSCLPMVALVMGTLGVAAAMAETGSPASDGAHFNLQSNVPDMTVEGRQQGQAARRAMVQSIREPSTAQQALSESETTHWDRSVENAAYESYGRRGFDPYEPPVWAARGRTRRVPYSSRTPRRGGSASLAQQSLQPGPIDGGPSVEEIIRGPAIAGDVGYGLPYDTGLYTEAYGSQVAPIGGCDCLGCQSPDWFAGCMSGSYRGGCLSGSCIGLDNAAIFGGVHAFKGPLDEGQNSNFGFQQGFNLGGALPNAWLPNLGYQVGFQATQSQLSGNLTSDDVRNQNFLTIGFFHREPSGLQYGIAWDWLSDDYHENHDLTQIRLEASVAQCFGGELGIWSAIGTSKHTYTGTEGGDTVVEKFAPVDQFAFFYRWRVNECGKARLWAGFTGQSEGLLGGDLTLPMSDRWALQGSVNYLIPKDDNPPVGTMQESWNLGFNVVWYFGCKAKYTECCSLYRPMFSVADNGTFFVDYSDRRVIDDDD